MIIIKKICVLVILGGVFSAPVIAETKPNRISISPTVGILYGKADEIVYKHPESDLYLSHLIWDLKPLIYAGLAVDFSPTNPHEQNGLVASASFKYGLPIRTGIMENLDWNSYRHNNITHYSRHDAYSPGSIFADISAGYSWSLNHSIFIKAYGEFSYMRLAWSARDGYLQYPSSGTSLNFPPWNDSLPKQRLSGEVIRYTQNWFIVAPGLSSSWKPSPYFSLLGNVNYSPLIYCYARDNHLLSPPRTFQDYLFFGHYINGNVQFSYSPAGNMDISLKLSYKYIAGTRGDSYENASLSRNGAGAGYSALGLGLAARVFLSGLN